MKEQLSKISGYFKIEKLKNDKRIIVFAVCLLIATTLWFLNALSKDYSTTISYPVKYINPPARQFLASQPPNKFELKVNAHGFTLLRHKLSLSFSPIVLNLTNITRNIEPNSNGYQIDTNALTRRISDQVSSEITIINILPDAFYIKLDSLITKMVPLKTNIEYNFKPQFNLKEPVTIKPNQIQITGPGTVLDTIYYLTTDYKKFDNLDADIIKTLKISHPEKITIKPEKAELNILVEKFTEKEIKIPIQVRNLPANKNLKLFPSEIKLTVLIGLSEFDLINAAKFEVIVDYNNIKADVENLEISIDKKPAGVQILKFTPLNVEFLIETN